MHDENCFVTLTYSEDALPYGETLHRPDFQKFMKRLIKNTGVKIRLYYCGEYGDTTYRPHYHACLFGWRPNDAVLFSQSGEYPLYESPFLTKTWGLGHATFGELTFDTAAYTARYVAKKITGAAAQDHYTTVDPDTGEIFTRVPEFSGMSRRPGIGMPWLQKYGRDAYEKDQVVLNGRPMKPPKAYDRVFEHTDPDAFFCVSETRLKNRKPSPSDRQLLAGDVIARRRLQIRDST